MSSAYRHEYLDPPHARRPFLHPDDIDSSNTALSTTAVGSGSSPAGTIYNSSSDRLINNSNNNNNGSSRFPPAQRAVEIPPGEIDLIPPLRTTGGYTDKPQNEFEGSIHRGSAGGVAIGTGIAAGTERWEGEQEREGEVHGDSEGIEPDEKASLFTRFTRRWRNPVLVGILIMLLVALILGLAIGLTKGQAKGGNNNKVVVRSRPYYPSPRGGWVPSWQDAYEQAAKLVRDMDVPEKVNLTTGVGWSMGPCVGNTGSTRRIGSLCLQDGPTGIRLADDITAFPAGVTVAATWSKYHMYARGKALGAEARAKGVNVILGPCMGPLGRFPVGGRNWEGFGSDPYLQGVASGITVEAIQSEGVIATAKHYIGNEQERFRQVPEAHGQGWPNVTEALSSNIGDRTLHELYLWPFAEAVRAGVGAIMCSYNQVNNSYACQNSYLLNGVLKDELGFQGFVMSDWLAHHSGVASALAGMDMSMPGDAKSFLDGESYWGSLLTESVVNKTLPIERLDDMALRIAATWIKMGQHRDFPEVSFSSWTKLRDGLVYQGTFGGPVDVVNDFLDVRQNHSVIAQEIAAEGIVMLKNFNNSALPLDDKKLPRAIVIFGSDAGPSPNGPNGCIDRGCNQGTLGQGWGSGSVDYGYQITPLEAIQARLLSRRGRKPTVEYSLEDLDLGRASRLAETPGAKCFVFVSSDSGEAYLSSEGHLGDRNDLNLWHNGDALIKTVAAKCNDTVVVVHSVGAVVMEEWIENPNVTAVLMAHLPASESGSSLVNVLWGDVPPSGHLPYTIGKSLEDYGPHGDILRQPNGVVPQDDFVEGLDIDYRYFDANGIEPRFEFGFGLSYTTFEYGNLTVQKVFNGNISSELPAPPDRLPVPRMDSEVPSPQSVTFPDGFSRLRNYHYPWLTRSQAAAVEGVLADENRTEYPYPEGWNADPRPNPPPGGGGEGGHPALYDVLFHVDIDVKNVGKRPGKTVPQLYVTFPDNIGVYTPFRQLRGFEKVGVGPGESVTVGFDVRRKDLSVWDEVGGKGWYIPSARGKAVGEGYTIWVGQSSRRGGVEGKTTVE